MADDVQLVDAASVTSAVAMDALATLNGVDVSATSPKAQRMKIVAGNDGVGTDVSTTNPLPISDAGGSLTVDGTVAVTAADGSSVSLGAVADAEATANGSVIALLKRLRTLLAGGLPGSLGPNGGMRTEILAMPALPSGGNNIGIVNVNTMPAASVSTDGIGAAPLAEVTLAGATPFKLNSAATTNATSVKASAGKVFFLAVFNTNAAVRYLKLYNKASAPTVGTDTPVLTFPIPGNTAAGGFILALPMPLKFATGIAFALTTGPTDADTGAVALNEITVNLGYV